MHYGSINFILGISSYDMPKLTIELAGGLESYFNNKAKIVLSTKKSDGDDDCVHQVETLPPAMRDLINLLKRNFLSVKEELFLVPVNDANDLSFTVRAGILTLVDDVDWEIIGGLDAPLDEAQCVTFISTLHGG